MTIYIRPIYRTREGRGPGFPDREVLDKCEASWERQNPWDIAVEVPEPPDLAELRVAAAAFVNALKVVAKP